VAIKKYGLTSIIEVIFRVLTDSHGFTSGLVLNFVYILGIIVFEWGLVEIIVTYLVEIAIIYFLFLIVGLFTSQPTDDRNRDVETTEPSTIQLIPLLPPIYVRNIRVIGIKTIIPGAIIIALVVGILSNPDVVSSLPLSVGIVVIGIILLQLMRVWRLFIIDQSYRDKSPHDAVQLAFAPIAEVIVIFTFAFAPVTLVVVGGTIVTDADLPSRLVLLLVYLIPIGAIRAWMRSLDPQTDDLEIMFG
jgi:uncharacterized membrane protein